MNFAKWTLCQQASKRLGEADIKNNTRKYLRYVKKKQIDAKQRDKFDRHIKSLTHNSNENSHDALIHSLQLMREDLFSIESDSEFSEESSEE